MVNELPYVYLLCGATLNQENQHGSGYRLGYDYGIDVAFLTGDGGLYSSGVRCWIRANGYGRTDIVSVGNLANPQNIYHIYSLTH